MQTSPPQTQATRSYRMEDWQGGNQALKQEFDYPITDIEGEIPADLRGTLFRNIPAMLDVNGHEVHHPFDADDNVRQFKVQSGFVFHHANAFEAGDELVIDSVAYRDFPSINHNLSFKEVDFDEVPASQLWRYRLNLNTQQVQRQHIETRCCDFPYVNPAYIGHPHRWIYLAATHRPEGNAPNQAILKVNPETREQDLWSAAPRGFVGEPVFVARPHSSAEDDGWLLVVVYDAERDRSDIVILNAQNLSAGPTATLHLRHHLPYGLHGSFTPEVWL